MEHDNFEAINHCIREAAQQTAAADALLAPFIERFLRTSEETWDGAGSGRFTLAQFRQNEDYRRAAKTALRTLFRRLASLLPAEAQLVPQVAPESIQRRIDPKVKGLCARRLAGGRPA